MGAGVRSGLAARRPVLVAALCGAMLPIAAAAAPWAGVLPAGPLAAAASVAGSGTATTEANAATAANAANAANSANSANSANAAGAAEAASSSAAGVAAEAASGADAQGTDGAMATAAEQVPAGGMRAARDEKLEQMRGGSDTPWSDMKLAGTVANNSAVNVVTGANIVTDSAFSNASGLPMVIQNSGANVLIQNATIINVQIK